MGQRDAGGLGRRDGQARRLPAPVEARGPKILGGEALDQTRTATTLRFEDGKDVLVTDGPFAEVKENLGGYYVIECKDLDEALEIGKRMPMTGGGSLEIRPIVPTGGS